MFERKLRYKEIKHMKDTYRERKREIYVCVTSYGQTNAQVSLN